MTIQIPPTRTQRKREQFIGQYIRNSPHSMYDIGVGPKSEWWSVSQLYPHIKIVGCEPHPDTFASVQRAGFPGTLFPVAISEQDGVRSLIEPLNDPMQSSLLGFSRMTKSLIVNSWTLDRFDREAGYLDRILLWMDIEGYELPSLRSGLDLLRSGRVRWINLEERRNGDRPAEGWTDPKELHEFLLSVGYRRVAEYNQHPTHQDVIYRHKDEPCSK